MSEMSDQPGPIAEPRNRVPPPDLPGVGTLLTLTASVVVVAALYFARDVLIPVTLAGLLSFLLAPLVSLLRRARIARVPAVLLAIIMALAMFLALGVVIEQQVADLAPDLPLYETVIDSKVQVLRQTTLGRLEALMTQLGGQFSAAPASAPQRGKHVPTPGTQQNPMTVQVQTPPPSALSLVQGVLVEVLSPLGTLLLVLIVAVFVLLQKEDLRDRLIRLFGSTDLHRTTLAMNDAGRRLSKYFLTQMAINAAFGVIVGCGLFLIGVPSPVLWGLVGTLARFVPYAGVLIASALPLLLAAGVDPTWHTTFLTLALYLVTEPIMGQVVEPLAYGHSTGLSPVSVVIAAIFWTWIWGPIGLLLATPLTLCLVVLGRHVKRLEFLDVLLGDRPALTPVESFYQRMLAGDPDEAATQAEILLRDRSLCTYYDEVALRSLQMAATDVVRGVLTAERQLRMRDALIGLLDDLDAHDDVAPAGAADDGPAAATPYEPRRVAPLRAPPRLETLPQDWTGNAPVLCVGGRGPLDDAAAAMTAQILGKHGVPAQVAQHEAVARAALASLDVSGVALVVVSYMEATGSPAHLRSLLRRLRRHMPAAPIFLALWSADLPPDPERDLRHMEGVDDQAASLRELITLCVEFAERLAGEPVLDPTAAAGAMPPVLLTAPSPSTTADAI
jgi:predicted PurR-regulated permease PerM